MRFDKKPPLKSDKKAPPKSQKKGSIGYNKKSALLEDAITHMNAGKYGRASSALKDLLALDPLNAEARRLFATLHLRLGSLMSARSAFESLAREAMERQDYWLAESLLREYLTAGPRYVPFLVMLGQVYEDKGDVMAAVAEYGKAVEVLLEDPDVEKPDQPSELFARIRSLAPGSPVAFRFAAMFDTVTGQVLQAAPSSAAAEVANAEPAAEAVPDSPVESTGLMPWEQMDPVPTSQASTELAPGPVAEPSPDVVDALVLPTAPAETVPAMTQQMEPPESPALPPAMVSEAKTEADGSVEMALPPVAVAPKSGAGEALDPIAPAAPSLESPGPEEAVVAAATQPSESALDLASPADPVVPVLAVLPQSGSHPIVEMPKSPAPMPWDQVEEVAILIPPPTESVPTAAADGPASSAVEAAAPSAPIEATTPAPTIEVLTQTSSLPIAQAPTSPAPMPWDQVQEGVSSTPAMTDLPHESPIEATASPSEEAAPLPLSDATTTAEPAGAPARADVTSSGLTWDEILAAVAAMQASPEPAAIRSQDFAAPVSDQVPAEPVVPLASGAPDGVGATPSDLPTAASIDSGAPLPSLSAPMPWEQIEAEHIVIPPQEPDSTAVPILDAPVEVKQDLTSAPVEPDSSELAATVDMTGQQSEVAPAVDAQIDAAPGFQLLSSDAPIEPQGELTPSPVEMRETVDASAPDLSPESGPLSSSMSEAPTEPAFRLAEPNKLTQTEPEVPRPVIEPVDEFSLADSQPLVTLVSPPEAVVPRVVPIEATPVQEQVSPALSEIAVEAAVTSGSPEPAVEPMNAQMEEPAVQPPAPVDPELSAVLEMDSVPEQELVVQPTAELRPQIPAHEAVTEPTECVPVPADVPAEPLMVSEIHEAAVVAEEAPLPTSMPVAPADVLDPVLSDAGEVPAEPVAVSAEEAPTALTAAPSEPVADEPVKILWDNALSAPPAPSSNGNMLTRWFKKSAETVPADRAAVPEIAPPADEPAALDASVPLLEAVPAEPSAPIEEPLLEPVAQATRVFVEEPPQRPTLNPPAGKSLGTRAGEAVASLVGAGVSTTRSLVVMALAFVGLLLFLVGGTVAAVALTWLVLEEQPSAAYRTMTSVPQKMLQDSAKNGYFLLLGFGAPAAQDPMQAGIDRRAESSDQALAHACLTGEGSTAAGEYNASAEVGKWIKTSDPAQQMSQHAAEVKALVSKHEVGLGRYRQWLGKPFEDEGYGQSISPNCGLILQAHRLYVADGFAQDVEIGMARLETDVTAWRTVFGQAKTMPMKLLAAAAINDDSAVMGGLLQRPELDERQISRVAKFARPLESTEQSIRWPMQSEFVLATKTVDEAISRDRSESRPFYSAIAAALPLPKQRRFNAYAEYYDVAGKAAAEGRYADLPKQSQFVHLPPYGVSDVVLNPIESLVGVDPLPTWEVYAGRVLETDARLRLASLQAWLRRTPSEQDLLTRLAKAGQGMYDPFTGLPMLVNLKKGVLYSIGPDLKDNEAQERFDLVAQIPAVAWTGGKKTTEPGAAK
ncbi:MAG: hypothetical protein JSR62_05320 [Nitrospira sp.]|nr:hypothetical protein [Nitrospira sp.]